MTALPPWVVAEQEAFARSQAMPRRSVLELIAALPEVARSELLAGVTPSEWRSLMAEPGFYLRPKQLPPPGDWRWWVLFAGRGFGKSLSASQWIRHRVEREGARTVGIIGPNEADCMEMLNDPGAGLFAAFPPEHAPTWLSKRDMVFSFHTGAIGKCYSAEQPELRGPNLDTAWVNEVVKFPTGNIDPLMDNLERALRITTATGERSCGIITTTPDPEVEYLKALLLDPGAYVVMGSTDENALALDGAYLRRLDQRSPGAEREARERHGRMIPDEGGGPLFSERWIQRVYPPEATYQRRIITIDPAIGTGDANDRTGMAELGLHVEWAHGVGRFPTQENTFVHLIDDMTGKHEAHVWADIALSRYVSSACDLIVAELNRGGNLVTQNLRAAAESRHLRIEVVDKKWKPRRTPGIVYVREVNSRGTKAERAAPVATAYQQGKVKHIIGGRLSSTEHVMLTWIPPADGRRSRRSPDELDVLVMGVSELLGLAEGVAVDYAPGIMGLGKLTAELAKAAPAARAIRPDAPYSPSIFGSRL